MSESVFNCAMKNHIPDAALCKVICVRMKQFFYSHKNRINAAKNIRTHTNTLIKYRKIHETLSSDSYNFVTLNFQKIFTSKCETHLFDTVTTMMIHLFHRTVCKAIKKWMQKFANTWIQKRTRCISL